MHFMNPVPLLPLVEVVRGLQSAPETIVFVRGLAERLGKTPVEAKDSPGDGKYRPAPLLRTYVAAGWLGRKAGRGVYSYD